MESVDTSPRVASLKTPEGPQYLATYIKDGINLVKERKYEEAIRHLRDPKTAKEVGLNFETDSRSYLIKKDLSQDEADELADRIAYDSGFNHLNKTITIADVWALGPEITGKPAPKIPQKLFQDVALVHLEEWLHGLQYLVGNPLAGYEDKELDVAAYLLKLGAPLTDNFLRRHGRYKHFPFTFSL